MMELCLEFMILINDYTYLEFMIVFIQRINEYGCSAIFQVATSTTPKSTREARLQQDLPAKVSRLD